MRRVATRCPDIPTGWMLRTSSKCRVETVFWLLDAQTVCTVAVIGTIQNAHAGIRVPEEPQGRISARLAYLTYRRYAAVRPRALGIPELNTMGASVALVTQPELDVGSAGVTHRRKFPRRRCRDGRSARLGCPRSLPSIGVPSSGITEADRLGRRVCGEWLPGLCESRWRVVLLS
jgi:hypothetical protein